MKRIFFAMTVAFIATSADACGPDTDCVLGDRHYRIAMPEDHDGATPVGAIVFAHGYRGSAHGVMRNMFMRRLVSDMGLALIAGKSLDKDWALPNSPSHFDSDGQQEIAYFEAVLTDATERFAIDRDRMMMTGFSAGGMMVWNLACAKPDLFAGFAPISGTFWLEPPATCATPVTSVIHIHGDADKTVPLDGRAIRHTRQGAVDQSLSMYAQQGDFAAAEHVTFGDLRCESKENATGEVLEFCLFEGGHSFRVAFLKHAWDRLKAAGRL
ncbi:prolyl oligopeptidase family serine peptidase [Ascidiaceihabitans sp.]|uniref:alpha/beta hydrolase family esterase n=1 Tax=Ascidiaceihabitans sp. TaxID=1872644 RepID=UPI00329694F8